MRKKKITFIQALVLAAFIILALGSSSSQPTTSSSSRYSPDAYSTPSKPGSGVCASCGGKGYIMRNGQKETCVCGGSGKATSFPN